MAPPKMHYYFYHHLLARACRVRASVRLGFVLVFAILTSELLSYGNCAPTGTDYQPSFQGGGFCLVDNNACQKEDGEFLESPSQVFNQLGCQQRCHDHAICEWWTWYEAQEWDSATRGVCNLFRSCGSRNSSCTFCYTGDRSCYRDENEQQVSAIIGGIFFETSINDVEVIEQSGHCKPGLVEDTPPEWVRWGHASATVGSSLYVCGGRDNFEIKNSCLRYDIVNRVWENDVSPMKFSRQGAKAVEAYGELYILGGHNGTHALNSVEIFNYEDGTWRQLEVPMVHPRADHCTATHEDGIYVLGGRSSPDSGLEASMELFNITTSQWSELKAPNLTRADHSCAFIENGLLVAGGRDLSGNNIRAVDFLNLTNHQWQPMAEMVNERYAFGLTVMNDTATAVGGHNGVTALKSAEQYSIGVNEWTLLELELDNARSEFSITGIPLSLLPEGC